MTLEQIRNVFVLPGIRDPVGFQRLDRRLCQCLHLRMLRKPHPVESSKLQSILINIISQIPQRVQARSKTFFHLCRTSKLIQLLDLCLL